MLFTLSGMTPYDYHAFLPLAQPLGATLKVPTTTAARCFPTAFQGSSDLSWKGQLERPAVWITVVCFPKTEPGEKHTTVLYQHRQFYGRIIRPSTSPMTIVWPMNPWPGGPKGIETLRSPHGLRRPFFGVHSNISIWGAVSGRSPVSRWKKNSCCSGFVSWQLAHIHWHSRATAVHLGLFLLPFVKAELLLESSCSMHIDPVICTSANKICSFLVGHLQISCSSNPGSICFDPTNFDQVQVQNWINRIDQEFRSKFYIK